MTASLAAVHERLRRYALFDVLEMLGRMDAVLRSEGERTWDVQRALVDTLFPAARSGQMWRRLHQVLREEAANAPGRPATAPVIFEPRLLASMAVLAGSILPPEGAPTGTPLEGLGEALLMLNDLIEGDLRPVEHDLATPEGRKAWVYYFAVVAVGAAADEAVHGVVRAVEIYLDAHPDLRDDPLYVDLAALFEDTTGLSLDAYMLVTLYLISRRFALNPETIRTGRAVIANGFFTAFPAPLRDQFLALAGQDAPTFCAAARKDWPDGEFKPLALRPVEQSPLVRWEASAVCVSARHLERRLTAGLYHVLLNARPEDKTFREHLQRFIGRVFEQYVERAMRRMGDRLRDRGGWHPRERRGRGVTAFITEAELVTAVGGPRGRTPSVCDGALVVGQDLFLVESKARFLSLPARTGEDPDAFFTRLRAITVGGIRQLHATVEHLAAGRLRTVGLEATHIRRIFPLVVSLDDLPIIPPVRAWIDDEVVNAGYLQQDTVGGARVHPAEILTARDLEWLELAVERTTARPGDLLNRKQSRAFWHGLGFATWARLAGVPPRDGRPIHLAHHAARWSALTASLEAYVRAHASERVDGSPADDGSPPDASARVSDAASPDGTGT